jgi:hypothetical protein
VVVERDEAGREQQAPVARWSQPPECPRKEHKGSEVVRAGTYGKRTANPRQRYRCKPKGEKAHTFTPPLPRDHVHVGQQACEHCDELRGVHRGETAVARRHAWSTRIVARGLDQLSAGTTYADVSRWALRAAGIEPRVRRRKASEPATVAEVAEAAQGGAKRRKSRASMESHNVWHIAADWCEVFSPVVFAPIEERLRSQALAAVEANAALRAAGEPVTAPSVWLLDDVPVYGRDADGSGRSRRDAGFYLLVLAEVIWEPGDPWAVPPLPEGRPRLRLVRAMPKSNAAAWRLVFDEAGYVPDYVVCDAGTGIRAGVEAHFDPAVTKFVPSLWHLARAVETALADTGGAFVATPAGRQLLPSLAEHLKTLKRGQPPLASTQGWSAWWDELEARLVAARLPRDKIRTRRRNYEASLAAVLPDLLAHPNVPVSTGGLETLISKHVQPMLAGRRASFGNIERTNRLFDLAVARTHGAFDDLSAVATLLRTDARAAKGWTTPLREVADPRPPSGAYSSLRDATLLADLAVERGLT